MSGIGDSNDKYFKILKFFNGNFLISTFISFAFLDKDIDVFFFDNIRKKNGKSTFKINLWSHNLNTTNLMSVFFSSGKFQF